uniref:U37-Austrotoxin-Ht1a_1 n=1 Tax=Hickmania troglodytes TaxID=489260 RepID=A0A482Z6W3_9ARAC
MWAAVAFLLVCLTLAVAEENLDMETAPQQREDCKKGEVNGTAIVKSVLTSAAADASDANAEAETQTVPAARLYPGEPVTLQLQSVIKL